MLLIAILLVLAVASNALAGGGERIYFLVDKSGSMLQTQPGGKQIFRMAIERVGEALKQYEPTTSRRVFVVFFDQAAYETGRREVRPGQVAEFVDWMRREVRPKISDRTFIGPRLDEVLEEIKAEEPERVEIHLISDLRESPGADPSYEEMIPKLLAYFLAERQDREGDRLYHYSWGAGEGPATPKGFLRATLESGLFRAGIANIDEDLTIRVRQENGVLLMSPVQTPLRPFLSSTLLIRGAALEVTGRLEKGQRIVPLLVSGSPSLLLDQGAISLLAERGDMVELTPAGGALPKDLTVQELSSPGWRIVLAPRLERVPEGLGTVDVSAPVWRGVQFLVPQDTPQLLVANYAPGRIATAASEACGKPVVLPLELAWNDASAGSKVRWALKAGNAAPDVELVEGTALLAREFVLDRVQRQMRITLRVRPGSEPVDGELVFDLPEVPAVLPAVLPIHLEACQKPKWDTDRKRLEREVAEFPVKLDMKDTPIVLEWNPAAAGSAVRWRFESKDPVGSLKLFEPENVELPPGQPFVLGSGGQRTLSPALTEVSKPIKGTLVFEQAGTDAQLPVLKLPFTLSLSSKVVLVDLTAMPQRLELWPCEQARFSLDLMPAPDAHSGRVEFSLEPLPPGLDARLTLDREPVPGLILTSDVNKPAHIAVDLAAGNEFLKPFDLKYSLRPVEAGLLLKSGTAAAITTGTINLIPSARVVRYAITWIDASGPVGDTKTNPLQYNRSVLPLKTSTQREGILSTEVLKVVAGIDPPSDRTAFRLGLQTGVVEPNGAGPELTFVASGKDSASLAELSSNPSIRFLLPPRTGNRLSNWMNLVTMLFEVRVVALNPDGKPCTGVEPASFWVEATY